MFEVDATVTHTENSNGNLKRSDEYIAWRLAVSDAFHDAGYDDVAERFEDCASHPKTFISSKNDKLPEGIATVWVCSDDPEHNNVVFSSTCDCRTCPDCARRQVARFAARYIPKALDLQFSGKPGYNLKHIVLTTPYALLDDETGQKYRDTFNAIVTVFDSVLKKNWRKEQGLLVAAEFGEDGHKLHFHIVHYGQYISKPELTEAWKQATDNECEITWIKSMAYQTKEETENAVIEIMKYSVKFFKVDDTGKPRYIEPELMPVLHEVLSGTRRVRSYGVFYGLGEPESSPFTCPECGAEMSRCGVSHWNTYRQTGYLLHEWQRITSGSLDLKLANKSAFRSGKADNREPPKQLMLPNLPAIRGD